MSVEKAQKLISEYQSLLSQGRIVIADINPNNHGDRSLALETALRGKTQDDYRSIVDGLFEAQDAEKDRARRSSLLDLTTSVMRIGERTLGIDWS
jgi:hypothetical protein